MRPERTRLETVDNIISRKAPDISRELARTGGLSAARRQVNPPEEHWWWYVDLYHAEKQRKSLIRGVVTVGSIILVVLVVNFVWIASFARPRRKEARSHTSAGDQLLFQATMRAPSPIRAGADYRPHHGRRHVTLGCSTSGGRARTREGLRGAREAYCTT